MEFIRNQSLKSYNTFGIDVYANYFAEVKSHHEIIKVLKFSKENQLEILVLNGGSNLLFTKDFDGLVLKINTKGIETIEENNDFIQLKVQAGENWHEWVQYCMKHDLGGLENLSLIPGNCGTAPLQNIGAYGVEIKDVLVEVTALEIATQKIKTFSNSDCEFGYRESVFKNQYKNQFILLDVTFQLTKRNHLLQIEYGAIRSELQNIDNPTIQDVSQAVVRIRQSKLPDPKIIGNAGSFFKNPVISLEKFQTLKKKFPEMPGYPFDNQIKTAAGWLIEQAGWKGKRFGDAGVHAKQALVLVNYGSATGKEIYDLSQKIILDIYSKFGIQLEREVNII